MVASYEMWTSYAYNNWYNNAYNYWFTPILCETAQHTRMFLILLGPREKLVATLLTKPLPYLLMEWKIKFFSSPRILYCGEHLGLSFYIHLLSNSWLWDSLCRRITVKKKNYKTSKGVRNDARFWSSGLDTDKKITGALLP